MQPTPFNRIPLFGPVNESVEVEGLVTCFCPQSTQGGAVFRDLVSTQQRLVFIAEQAAPAPHLAHSEGCAALRIVLGCAALRIVFSTFRHRRVSLAGPALTRHAS